MSTRHLEQFKEGELDGLTKRPKYEKEEIELLVQGTANEKERVKRKREFFFVFLFFSFRWSDYHDR
jgi:hypothetical protein